jgi:hypothetical protein
MGHFITKQTKMSRDRQMIAGLEKHFGPADTLRLEGGRYTPKELGGILEQRIELSEAVLAAKAALAEAVRQERENTARTARLVAALRKVVHLMFGPDLVTLSDFGVAPHKERRPLTAEEKLVVVAKILATRAARHTMGKRQKLAIRGDTTPVVIVTMPRALSPPTPT